MAIREYQENGNTLYQVSVERRSKVNQGLRITRMKSGIESYSEAQKIEKRLTEEVVRKILLREQNGQSWREIVVGWESALYEGRGSERPVQESTIMDNINALRMYTSGWMDRPASGITRTDVRDVLYRLESEGRSKSRQRAIKNAISGAFRWAIDYGKIRGVTQSPTQGIKLGKGEEKKPDILTLTEIRNLLEAARHYKHPWFPIWAMALHTGMRSGELNALLWTDVDFENRMITVNKSWNCRFKAVKSTKSSYWREVPLNQELETLLKELRLTSNGRKEVLPRFQDWDRGESARILKQFCVGIGIRPVKFHALRACFATQLLKANIPPVVVMRICGWRELKTMQVYVRLSGVEIEGATEKLHFVSPETAMGKVIDLFGSK